MKAREVNSKGLETKHVEKIGRELVEHMENHERSKVTEKYKPVVEKVRTAKEALGDDSSLYSAVVADFIRQAFQPKLLAQDAIAQTTIDMNGSDTLKIPKDELLDAQDINSDGTWSGSEEETGYGDESISVSWVGAYTDISIPLIRKANVDMIVHRLEQIGNAIGRKVDTDIVTEMENAGTKDDSHYGDNDNYKYLGTDETMDLKNVFDAMTSHRGLKADPNLLITNNDTYYNLLSDSDTITALGYGTTPQGEVPETTQIGSLTIMTSTQVSSDKAILVDTNNAGYFIDASGVETWDGRVVGRFQHEVMGAKAYGCRIVRPESVFVIHEDEAEP